MQRHLPYRIIGGEPSSAPRDAQRSERRPDSLTSDCDGRDGQLDALNNDRRRSPTFHPSGIGPRAESTSWSVSRGRGSGSGRTIPGGWHAPSAPAARSAAGCSRSAHRCVPRTATIRRLLQSGRGCGMGTCDWSSGCGSPAAVARSRSPEARVWTLGECIAVDRNRASSKCRIRSEPRQAALVDGADRQSPVRNRHRSQSALSVVRSTSPERQFLRRPSDRTSRG